MSYNKIVEIDSLNSFVNLISIDLSHNEIIRVTGLESLQKLTILDLSHNNIEDYVDIKPLVANINLTDLKLIFNPFSE